MYYEKTKAKAMVEKFVCCFGEADLLHAIDAHFDKPDSFLKDRVRNAVKAAQARGTETRLDGASAFDTTDRAEVCRMVEYCVRLVKDGLVTAVEEGRFYTARVVFKNRVGRGFYKGVDFKNGALELSAVLLGFGINYDRDEVFLASAYPVPSKNELETINGLRKAMH